ncbi:hypothetical protein ACFL27_08980 [candidate division CSSED10-310 bacterium]|uniref:Uncharacterized protein n=1 Tax=candidate division CSSED10-310 bacterium TaxID=2855610 RepID=A0ABV6YVS5_UNCC1
MAREYPSPGRGSFEGIPLVKNLFIPMKSYYAGLSLVYPYKVVGKDNSLEGFGGGN